MNKRLAFTTFAILKKPYGNPEVQEFDDRTPSVFALAENSEGFISRAVECNNSSNSNFERDWGPWGKFEVPRFYKGGRTTKTDQRASTLSIWKDIESVFKFTYSNGHMEALKRRHQWFLKPEWPTYACWWIDCEHIPTWLEACQMLEYLHDNGPTEKVFNFKVPFDMNGKPYKINK